MVYIPNEILNIIFSYMSSPIALIINEKIKKHKAFIKFIKEEFESDDEEFDELKYCSFTEYYIDCYKFSKYIKINN